MEESRTDWRDEFEEFLEACLEGASDKTMSNISFRNRIAQVATQFLDSINREKPPERRSEPEKIGGNQNGLA